MSLFIANGGQNSVQLDLVDTVVAMVHFVASLILSGEIEHEIEPIDNNSLVGSWEIASPTESDFLLLSFFQMAPIRMQRLMRLLPTFCLEWNGAHKILLGLVKPLQNRVLITMAMLVSVTLMVQDRA